MGIVASLTAIQNYLTESLKCLEKSGLGESVDYKPIHLDSKLFLSSHLGILEKKRPKVKRDSQYKSRHCMLIVLLCFVESQICTPLFKYYVQTTLHYAFPVIETIMFA